MKKHFLIISLLFVFGIGCNAQSDSRTNFEKAVDYLNCKMVENSLKPYPSDFTNFTSKCNCDTLPNYGTIIAAYNTSKNDQTSELSKETEKLKTRGVNITDSIKYLTGEIFNDKDFQILKIFKDNRTKKNKDTSFNGFIDSVKPNIKNILKCGAIKCEFENTGEGTDISKIDDGNKNTISNSLGDNTNQNTNLWLIIGLIFLVAIASFFYINYKITIIEDKIKEKSGEIDSSPPSTQENTTTSSTIYHEEIAKLKEAIEQLQNNQQQIIKAIQKQPAPPQPTKNSSSHTASSSPNIIGELYFPAPDEDGAFDNTTGSPQYKDGKSIYKFELTGTKDALFSIDTRENAVLMALKFPEARIYKVCEQTDGINPHDAKTIITTQKGVVHLIDNKWRLINKAKIKFS